MSRKAFYSGVNVPCGPEGAGAARSELQMGTARPLFGGFLSLHPFIHRDISAGGCGSTAAVKAGGAERVLSREPSLAATGHSEQGC